MAYGRSPPFPLVVQAQSFSDADQRREGFVSHPLRELRDDQGVDQTLRNLMRALTLKLELRARYRVFEFEASQDGDSEIARLFGTLRHVEADQISQLMAGLKSKLAETALAPPDPLT